MKKALFIEGNRSGYAPDQVEDSTMTIRELIDELESWASDCGDETKVFLRNDNGYTYGEFSYNDISSGEYDEDTGEVSLDE